MVQINVDGTARGDLGTTHWFRLWGFFGVIRGAFCGGILVILRGRSEVSPGSVWGHSGVIPGSFRGHSGVIPGSFRGHSGVVQGSFRSHLVRSIDSGGPQGLRPIPMHRHPWMITTPSAGCRGVYVVQETTVAIASFATPVGFDPGMTPE